MKLRDALGGALVVLVVGGVGTAVYFGPGGPADTSVDPVPPPPEVSAELPGPPPAEPVVADAEPVPRVPQPDPASAVPPPPLPALADSDTLFQQALLDLIGLEAYERYVIPQALVLRFVVMIDNMTGASMTERMRSFRRAEGDFVTDTLDGRLYWSAGNASRYRPFVSVVEHLDVVRAAAFYRAHYPLFQQAYEQLGYRGRSFNQRFVAVIDHLLAAPDVSGPVELMAARHQYEFVDPQLRALSWGQKSMVRLGPDNAAILKARLRELRAELARP